MGSLFSKSKAENYDSILSSLAERISTRKSRLADIRLRERRATLLFTVYSIVVWAGYVGAWYVGVIPTGKDSDVKRALRTLPVGLVPILIFFIRRLVKTFYAWRASIEEKQLKSLLTEQKAKIAEIKKATNYDSTRTLLERYANEPPPAPTPFPPSTPVRQRLPGGPPGTGSPITTPIRAPGIQPAYLQPSDPRLPPPQQSRKWYDTLADALLGPDDSERERAEREKYALICGKCFAHNGLVPREEWEDIQYKCPKCGHFNPSRRSLRTAQPSSLPPSPTHPRSPTSLSLAPVPPASSFPLTPTIRGPSGLRQEVVLDGESEGDGEGGKSKEGEGAGVAGDVSMMDVDWAEARMESPAQQAAE